MNKILRDLNDLTFNNTHRKTLQANEKKIYLSYDVEK